MENKKPLLSICIPTYNRSEYLDICIASIVSQKDFLSEDVELVISDNASTDNTEEVVRKYQEQYKNIFYSRNEVNNTDKNFPTVIGKAHGVFRKLFNDTLIFFNGSIMHILGIIKKYLEKRPVLFFMNNNNRKWKKILTADCFDSFVKIASFWTTAIACFGIWEDDFEKIENKYDGCELHLWQTKVLFEIVARKKVIFIDNVCLFLVQELPKRNIFGYFDIFYNNYYIGLCGKYFAMQLITKKNFFYLKKHLFLDFFLNYMAALYINEKKYEISRDKDMREPIIFAYQNEVYYKYYYFLLIVKVFKMYIRNKLKKFSIIKKCYLKLKIIYLRKMI